MFLPQRKRNTIVSALIILITATVITGWLTNNLAIIKLNENFPPMQFNTALCLILLALANIVPKKSKLSCAKYIISIIVVIISFATFLEYLTNINLNIDNILNSSFDDSLYPGRMAPNTAFCFTLLGLANIFSAIKVNTPLFKSLYISFHAIVILLAGIAMLGYIFDISYYFSWGRITGMALHTSICLLLLSISKFSFQGIRFFGKKISIIVSSTIFVTFFTLWMYAIDHDSSEIRNKVNKNLAFLHTNLERKLDLEHNSVNRLYKRISSSSYSSKQAILADFKAYEDDYPSIYFIYYLDPEPIFSSRYDIDEGQALSILKNCNLQNKSNVTLVCFQKQNDKFNVVFKPNFSKEVINDFNSDNYNLEIFLEGKKIYSNLSPNDTYSLAISESFSGAKYWKITAYFTTTDYEKLQRSFPLVFFILGILISIMAHVFFHLLNINSRKNKILNLNERKLKKLNSIDPLTNSLNRNSLMNELEAILKDNRLTNSQTAVLFIDLDNFKYINDNYGHNTGDKILVETVNRLHLNLRLNDLIARSGGDEFVIVLKNINSKDEIIKILERIFASFAEKIYLRDDLIITQSLSIGISIIDQDNDLSADDIIKQADDAMYIAKRRGKNQYHFFK